MLEKFMPREENFFDFFEQAAELILEAAIAFQEMLGDLQHSDKHARRIKEIEHRCDTITHQTIEALHKTFITPLDRADIHQLICEMDDIVDYIDSAATRTHLYEIKVAPKAVVDLADICFKAAEIIKKAVRLLRGMKHPNEISKYCIQINQLENEADHILRSALAKLFKKEPDLRLLIKLKEILELLETVTDRCEDVSNIIDWIVLEYA
ncbi:MAG: DUF47 domain-containing protein [Deltaproteobacteria bacterium]|nr:DUF47 domain-containing protein [Deltaproteobacteria bacterium]